MPMNHQLMMMVDFVFVHASAQAAHRAAGGEQCRQHLGSAWVPPHKWSSGLIEFRLASQDLDIYQQFVSHKQGLGLHCLFEGMLSCCIHLRSRPVGELSLHGSPATGGHASHQDRSSSCPGDLYK